ncbi:uncharacterized protein LOC132258576 isoform X2 [Phlebotomus argentipes]|uniref:uncharacterized protein LOC132258576 isoform X2 n=1 Tax=Phlebotomus argentipes TaxID=94469 RepID=UPI002892BB34|nr:uncharacterized protein LOC132258576 isoform X2 [Phlebotomus argentipes]
MDNEFKLEDVQDLISDAQATIRSVRTSLRLRELSIEEASSELSEGLEVREHQSQVPDRENQNNSATTSAHTMPIAESQEPSREQQNPELLAGPAEQTSEAQSSAPMESADDVSSGNIDLDNADSQVELVDGDAASVRPQILPDACNLNDTDEIILVSETRNPNPVVIDLCTPESPRTTRRSPVRRKRRSQSAVEERDDASTPNKTRTSSVTASDLSCVICMEDMRPRQPFSTPCGHVFCKKCITTAITTSKRCPICRKIISLKAIHPLYLFAK